MMKLSSPQSPTEYSVYICPCDPEFQGYGAYFSALSAQFKFTDFLHIGFCEFSHWMILSFERIGIISTAFESSFLNTIMGIIGGSSQEEMIRVNAGRIVAFVQNPQIISYRAEMNNPGNPMGCHSYSIFISDLAIFSRFLTPKPASFSFCDIPPKSLSQRVSPIIYMAGHFIGAIPAAIFSFFAEGFKNAFTS